MLFVETVSVRLVSLRVSDIRCSPSVPPDGGTGCVEFVRHQAGVCTAKVAKGALAHSVAW
jgi:hypothetical protein